MELKSLINLPNQYPDNRDIKESYAQKNSEITYTGKFKKNQIYFSDIPIENINVVDGVSFNFLVEFNSEREKYYTSQTFLDKMIADSKEKKNHSCGLQQDGGNKPCDG